MTESATTFGAGGHLLGVLTAPPPGTQRPCLLLLNAGLVHRVGPGRLSVEFARRAASAGFPAFRFDLSGIGDSGPRLPPSGPVRSAVADVREAMDHLGATHGMSRFVVAGLCSGAVNAHHAAVADERIVGAILLDAYVFPTVRSRLRQAAEHLSAPIGLLRRGLRRARRYVLRTDRPGTVVPADEDILPRWPARSAARRDLRRLRDRGGQLLYVYSGEWGRRYRYEGQVRDAFGGIGLGGLISEKLIPGAEHLYFTRTEREALFTTVLRWLDERFPAESSSA